MESATVKISTLLRPRRQGMILNRFSGTSSLRRRRNSICSTSRIISVWVLVALIFGIIYQDSTLIRANDDNYAANADDGNAANDDNAADDNNESNDDTSSSSSSSSSSSYENEQKQYQNTDDDTFHWNSNIGFDGVSVMPLSCIN